MKARMEEYRKRDSGDLLSELDDKRREVFNLRFSQASERATDPQLLKNLRKEVARIKTVLRERELRGED
jgi:large subunit ribosomal protein L29